MSKKNIDQLQLILAAISNTLPIPAGMFMCVGIFIVTNNRLNNVVQLLGRHSSLERRLADYLASSFRPRFQTAFPKSQTCRCVLVVGANVHAARIVSSQSSARSPSQSTPLKGDNCDAGFRARCGASGDCRPTNGDSTIVIVSHSYLGSVLLIFDDDAFMAPERSPAVV